MAGSKDYEGQRRALDELEGIETVEDARDWLDRNVVYTDGVYDRRYPNQADSAAGTGSLYWGGLIVFRPTEDVWIVDLDGHNRAIPDGLPRWLLRAAWAGGGFANVCPVER